MLLLLNLFSVESQVTVTGVMIQHGRRSVVREIEGCFCFVRIRDGFSFKLRSSYVFL